MALNGSNKMGLGDLMKLMGDPTAIPALIAKTMPGIASAVGLLPLGSRIALAAQLLSLDVQAIVSTCIMNKRDLNPTEIEFLAKRCAQIFHETEALYNYKQGAVTPASIAAAFGFKPAPASSLADRPVDPPPAEPAAADAGAADQPSGGDQIGETVGKA